MRILLAMESKESREMISFCLGSRYKAEIIEAKTAKDAVRRFDEQGQHGIIDLVISDYPGVGDVLFKHIASRSTGGKRSTLPCVVCSDKKQVATDPILSRLKVVGHAHWENIVDDLYKILDQMKPQFLAPDEEAPDDGDFCRISTNLLLRVSPLKADVYIRLSKKKYIKLFREGDAFDTNDYKRYMLEKGLEYFYLKRTESGEFIAKFQRDLLKLLLSRTWEPAAIQELTLAVHDTVQELISKLGPTPEVQDLVRSSVKLSIQSMGKNPRLGQLLARIHTEKKKYLGSHSVLLSHLSCALAAAMDWSSEPTFQKLNLAAFMHDITLTNNSLAALQSMKALEDRRDKFTDQEVRAFRLHPVQGAELARQFSEIPPDVDTIITQHHELPDGSGFPRGLTSLQISPLASVFIAAHELVSLIFERDSQFRMEEFLEAAANRYSSGNFKKIFKALQDIESAA